MDILKKAIANFQTDGNAEALFSAVKEQYAITTIAPMVQDYLLGKTQTDGYFIVQDFGVHAPFSMTYQKVCGEFDDTYFPALAIGGDGEGTEFWLMLETGKVITLHHDATFYEEACCIQAESKQEFCEKFSRIGSYVDLNQLIAINQLGAYLEGSGEEGEKAFLMAVAQLFGMDHDTFLAELQANSALEFLRHPVAEYLEYLEYGDEEEDEE